jgi:outer membrane protein OmpA-like peptidoglycan-associated protein
MFSQDDDNQGLVIGVLFGVIALVIASVIGLAIYKTKQSKAVITETAVATAPVITPAATPAAAATPANLPAPAADGSVVKIENSIVKFFFASGKSDLPAGGPQALAEILQGVKAGKKVMISGFVDPSGDAQKNAELAKQRAFAVRDLLKSLDVPDDKIVLVRPNDIKAGATTAAQGRRVEVALF